MRKKYDRILGAVAFSIESVIRENVGDLVDGSDPEASFATPSEETAEAGEVATPSTADDLARIADLYERGLLTEEQFEAAKSKLLG